jgi:hypothetical protein
MHERTGNLFLITLAIHKRSKRRTLKEAILNWSDLEAVRGGVDW